MIDRRKLVDHDGPCTFDPEVGGVEKVWRGVHKEEVLIVFCRCGKYQVVKLVPESEQKQRFHLWPADSKQPIWWATGILILVLAIVRNKEVRDFTVYPLRLLMIGASFMSARAVYRFLDPTWDERKRDNTDSNKLPPLKGSPHLAAWLVFFATLILLESLPTHTMATSFAREAFR